MTFDPNIPIEEAWTPPADWYCDPAVLAREKRAIFQNNWLCVARKDQLELFGAYVSGCIAGEPFVIVRGHDGVLRAMANVCRHNATQIMTGAGQVDELQCPYHGWTYSLEGRLVRAPRMAGIQGFDRGTMSLPNLAVCEVGPLVFINFQNTASPLQLGELGQRLNDSGWENLTHVESRSYDIECNWKVFLDNYLDGGYHVPFLHKALADKLQLDHYRTEIFDHYSIQSVSGETQTRIGDGALYAFVYPNLMLNRYGNIMDINWVVPKGPTRCRVEFDWYFAEPNDPSIGTNIAESHLVQQEDVQVCESVQIGLASSTYDRGRYAPRVEMAKHHFHTLVANELKDWKERLG